MRYMADPTDKNQGVIEGQELQSDWNKKAEGFFGIQGAEELNRALSVYAGYPKASLIDPAIQIEISEQVTIKKEIMMESLMRTISVPGGEYISKSGLLKKDIFSAMEDFQRLFKEKYPNCFSAESQYSESELILELRSRFLGYLLYLFISREKENMKMIRDRIDSRKRKTEAMEQLRRYALDNSKVKEFKVLYFKLHADPELIVELRGGQLYMMGNFKPIVNESLYKVMTNLDGAVSEAAQQGTSPEMLVLINQLYSTIKTRWIPLLTTDAQKFKKYPGNINQLSTENNRVFSLIREEGNREIPMCTTDNKTLVQGESLVMQFTPVEKGLKDVYRDSEVQVNYHGGKEARAIKANRAIQETHRARETGEGILSIPIAISDPKFPVMFVDRFSGQIRGLSVYPELLKVIAGSTKSQEIIRRDILIYLAQLVCKPETLNKIFGSSFLQQATPKSQPQAPNANPSSLPAGQGGQGKEETPTGSQAGKPPYLERQYPYGLPDAPAAQRAMAIFTALQEDQQAPITYLTPGIEIEADRPMSPEEIARAIENLKKSLEEGEIVSHKRLLPLIRKKVEKPEGITYEIIGSFEPTEKAIERARDNGRVLRKGVEFPHRGEIFYPDQVPDLLQTFGHASVEELAARYPDEAYIRYETWVDPEETRREKLGQAIAPSGDIEIKKAVADVVSAAKQATGPKAIIAKVKLPEGNPVSASTSDETKKD